MTEVEAAQAIGENIATIITVAAGVPVVLAAPIVALFGLGSFLFGKKYERKWNSKLGRYVEPVVETIKQFEEENDTSNT